MGTTSVEVVFVGTTSVEVVFVGTTSVEVVFVGTTSVEVVFVGTTSVEVVFVPRFLHQLLMIEKLNIRRLRITNPLKKLSREESPVDSASSGWCRRR